MPHQTHLRTLGRKTDHRMSMLRGLAVDVLRYERVKTTEAKAKEVRGFVDKIVNLGREGSLPARRRALSLTQDPLIVEKAFSDLRERFADRVSGYTRLTHLGRRVGDGAPVMLVELIEGRPAQAKPDGETPAPASGVRGIARRLRRGGEAKAEAPAAPEEKGAAKAARVAERTKAQPKPKAAATAKKKPEKKTEKPIAKAQKKPEKTKPKDEKPKDEKKPAAKKTDAKSKKERS